MRPSRTSPRSKNCSPLPRSNRGRGWRWLSSRPGSSFDDVDGDRIHGSSCRNGVSPQSTADCTGLRVTVTAKGGSPPTCCCCCCLCWGGDVVSHSSSRVLMRNYIRNSCAFMRLFELKRLDFASHARVFCGFPNHQKPLLNFPPIRHLLAVLLSHLHDSKNVRASSFLLSVARFPGRPCPAGGSHRSCRRSGAIAPSSAARRPVG